MDIYKGTLKKYFIYVIFFVIFMFVAMWLLSVMGVN